MVQYAKCRQAVHRFLNNGRIGAIGHISCIDRRLRIAASSDENDLTNDIACAGAGRMAGICNLLGQEPVSVSARLKRSDRVTSLQAFLQVNAQIGIHYFATFDDAPVEHELWIEGSEGSLRTNGNSVWWRKRGWPVFIPTRIGLFGAPSDSAPEDGVGVELAAAILKSERDREAVSLVNGE